MVGRNRYSDGYRYPRLLALVACLLIVLPFPVDAAEPFSDLLSDVLERHDRIEAVRSDLDAAKERAKAAFAPLYPTLDVTANYGWETQLKHEAAKTSTSFQEADLSLTQLLWDFGASYAGIERTRLQISEQEVSLISVRQDLIEEAANAYVDLRRSATVLLYAQRSEANILDTTGLEEARVEAGGGLSTDVLQAKTQLAEAESRRIAAEGAMRRAENRYRAVFDQLPGDLESLFELTVADSHLPISLEDALDLATAHNTDLQLASLSEAIARQDLRETRQDAFFPKLEAIAERKWKNNVGGTLDFKGETLAKVELSFPFNLGFTAVNTLRAAQSDITSQSRRMGDTRRNVEEEVRNAWQSLDEARQTAAARHTQAEISAAFLELAREERSYGQRSLIDVLSGETSLINARSDAANAEAGAVAAAITLLRATGRLTPEVFVEQVAKPLNLPEPDPYADGPNAVQPMVEQDDTFVPPMVDPDEDRPFEELP
ncbi:TolC family protein [Magnetospira sp. QH-2]|uniref:TolC family protein n=1 Tax=Magnetospira sp. (strain QH-2) TaxID=1288970 RepID=UPI0011DC7C37|nr:TolC family protein [Magnetospira sp. QH-2]